MAAAALGNAPAAEEGGDWGGGGCFADAAALGNAPAAEDWAGWGGVAFVLLALAWAEASSKIWGEHQNRVTVKPDSASMICLNSLSCSAELMRRPTFTEMAPPDHRPRLSSRYCLKPSVTSSMGARSSMMKSTLIPLPDT